MTHRFGYALRLLLAMVPSAAGCRHGGDVGPGTDAAADAAVDPRMTFRTSDGWTLVGDFWTRVGATPEADLLLVHQLGSDRHEWDPLIAFLRAHHPHWGVLAIDLRGHGESTRGPDGPTTWASFGNDTTQWQGLETDVRTAVMALHARTGAPRMYLVGSSIGSSAVIREAAAHRIAVDGVVLLSPGLRYHGLDTRPALTAWAREDLPALLVASAGDTDPATAVLWYTAGPARGHTGIATQLYPDAQAHGVSMGARDAHPDLWERITNAIDSWRGREPHPAAANEADAGSAGRDAD